jgi:hypothetical protein
MGRTRSNANELSGRWHVAMLASAILLPVLLTGCGKKGQAAN